MSALDLEQLTRAADEAARAGGEIVVAHFGGAGNNVRAKAPGDWVSDVDTASEVAVRDVLAAEAPGIAFFGEESGGERAALGWLVDPQIDVYTPAAKVTPSGLCVETATTRVRGPTNLSKSSG